MHAPQHQQPHSALPWTLVNLTTLPSSFVNTGSNEHPQLALFSHLDEKLSPGNMAGCLLTSSHGYSLMPPQKRPACLSRQKYPVNY